MSVVAIQGVRGSYSEEAVFDMVDDALILECDDFAAAFAAVRSERADYALVPVENKIVGEIEGAMCILRSGGFRELARKPLRVRHVLAGTRDSSFRSIGSVTSHVEALKQCRRYLTANPNWTQIVGADTASSVRRVMETGDPTAGAIGSGRAAEMYGAKILAENIADDPDNWTTFCLIGA